MYRVDDLSMLTDVTAETNTFRVQCVPQFTFIVECPEHYYSINDGSPVTITTPKYEWSPDNLNFDVFYKTFGVIDSHINDLNPIPKQNIDFDDWEISSEIIVEADKQVYAGILPI